MSLIKRRWRVTLATVLVFVAAALVAFLPLLAQSRSKEPRDITIVAREMAFYVDSNPSPNPTIRLAPGERVRIVFVNDDLGFDHDFAVSAWSAATRLVHGKGRASVVIQVPAREGTAAYVCSTHASMMTGTIEVTTSEHVVRSER